MRVCDTEERERGHTQRERQKALTEKKQAKRVLYLTRTAHWLMLAKICEEWLVRCMCNNMCVEDEMFIQ